MNRALMTIPRRAESRHANELRATFVDSGIADAMRTVDHQIIYGRRGTGKTHALRFLEGVVKDDADLAVYLDLRTVGSPDGLFMGQRLHLAERAGRLLRDLLQQFYDQLLELAFEDESLLTGAFLDKMQAFQDAVTSVQVIGEVSIAETEQQVHQTDRNRALNGRLSGQGPAIEGRFGKKASNSTSSETQTTHTGNERVAINFGDMAKAIRDLAGSMQARRVWLLLDEWSSVPPDVQPYLAEFLVRCVLPLQIFTVKIAAIEQQSSFSIQDTATGARIGAEVGADIAANLDLDDFMVFEQGSDRAREFFVGLFFKHLTSGNDSQHQVAGLLNERDLIRLGFTDRRAFDELVRAAEGVPRDALNIASAAALKAVAERISVPNVRAAARAWFLKDKEAALSGQSDAGRLLNWIIDSVIRGKRARAFLVNRRDSRSPILMALFEARVLHLVRRGYSAQDQPGERYDVFSIDYGAYVDLIQTNYEPQGLLAAENEGEFVDVPTQDLRAIRRSILDLDAFFEAQPS
ncbi:ATP-binding protein [Nocardioides sp. SYSU D00065]|uniref:ATP-binding protein n=1 Tax=Nocardioides sp. SYSU D00065 TaxID=2817378 RepID=UPI001FEDEBAA|nr:ATP-binding protein [Nocardioides sp. SYSU D00065]